MIFVVVLLLAVVCVVWLLVAAEVECMAQEAEVHCDTKYSSSCVPVLGSHCSCTSLGGRDAVKPAVEIVLGVVAAWVETLLSLFLWTSSWGGEAFALL